MNNFVSISLVFKKTIIDFIMSFKVYMSLLVGTQ